MSILTHSPAIVRDGLVLCLDAGAVRSYPGTGPELVSNGNFESSFTNYWTIRAGQTEGNQVLTQDSSIVKSGTYSAKIVVGGSSPNYDGMKSDSSGNFTLTNGKRYLFSFDVYPVNDTGIDAYIVAGSTYCGANVTGLTQGAWNNVELFIDVTATSSSSFVEFQTGSAWGNGTWYFDNVSVREVLWNDLSGNFNNGTLVNAPAFSAESGAGGTRSFDFDGSSDYMNLGAGSSLNFGTGDITMDAWVKTTQSSEGQILRMSYTAPFVVFGVASGKLRAGISDGSNSANDENNNGPTVNDGNWHHVAVVFNRIGNIVFYKDAVATTGVSMSSVTGSVGAPNPNAAIGRRPNHDSQYFDGKITCVRAYNRALSAAEIQQNYRAHKGRFGL